MFSTYILITIFILGLVSLVFWRRYQDWWIPKIYYDSLSSILPFDRILEDKETILFNNGSLAKVIAINAVNYAILSKDAQEDLLKKRRNYFDKMAQQNAHIRIFSIRDKNLCSSKKKISTFNSAENS